MSNEVTVSKKIAHLMKHDNIQERLKAMLDKNAESFVTSVINTVNGSTALQSCEPMTIVKSAMVAATLNLPVDPNLGFAAIVPYKDKKRGMEAQFQIMYKGLVQLAIRSGQYENLNVSEVFADELDYYDPFTGEVTFKPYNEWKMRYEAEGGEVVGYYAYFKLLTGFKKALYMTKAEVEKHALAYSQSYKQDKEKGWNSSRWSKDFDSMAKKTVLKQLLSKYGILSIELQRAVTFDQARVGGSVDNPEPEYIDNPEYKEMVEVENPFVKKDVVEIDYTVVDEDLPDFK